MWKSTKSKIFEANSEIFEAKSGIFKAKSRIFTAKSGIMEAKFPKPNPGTQKSIKNPPKIHYTSSRNLYLHNFLAAYYKSFPVLLLLLLLLLTVTTIITATITTSTTKVIKKQGKIKEISGENIEHFRKKIRGAPERSLGYLQWEAHGFFLKMFNCSLSFFLICPLLFFICFYFFL